MLKHARRGAVNVYSAQGFYSSVILSIALAIHLPDTLTTSR